MLTVPSVKSPLSDYFLALFFMSLIDENLIALVGELLVKRLTPVAVYLFGSAAKGHLGPESDLDFAVFSSQKISSEQRESIKENILAKFGVELDLIDFNAAPPPLQAEILRYGKRVFVSDEQALATMRMRALRSYQMLNDERQPVLDKKLGAEGWKRLF